MSHQDDASNPTEQPRAPLPNGRSGLWFRFAPEQRLGEILLEMGAVSKQRLNQAIVAQGYSSDPLGKVLVDMNALDPEVLEEAYRIQQQTPASGEAEIRTSEESE